MKLLLPTFVFLIFSLSGCSQQNDSSNTPELVNSGTSSAIEYNFAIHPLHNPTLLFEVFNPLMDYLNENIPGVIFKVEASRDYATFDNKLKSRAVPFALPNPYQTLMAIDNNYKVIAKMGDDQNFKGIILVRKDSNIKTPADLKGHAVSYPAPTALAATMLPQYYLHNNGLNINKDIENKFVGSQESSIMNVFHGTTMAGATWPPPWKALSDERPEIKAELKVIWETQALPNNGIVVRDDVQEELAMQVQTLLVNLHKTKQGQEILQKMYLSKYEKADNDTYQVVRDFIENFAKNVRPL